MEEASRAADSRTHQQQHAPSVARLRPSIQVVFCGISTWTPFLRRAF